MDRLEDALRSAELSAGPILLLRGGEDTDAKLLRQAGTLESRFTFDGRPARGISLFAARGDLDARTVLASKLQTYRQYRRVAGATLADVVLLLPTFQAPHWTALLRPPAETRRSEKALIADLLDILGPVLDNPKYVPDRSRR